MGTPETSPSKPQKKGPNKFLAFLGCCSSSEVDNDDTVLPAKKTTMRPAASNRLPTPDKAEAHAGDSSTAESREPYLDEKANSTVSADHPGDEERNVQASSGEILAEGPSTRVAHQPEASGQKKLEEDTPEPIEVGKLASSAPGSKTSEPTQDLDVQANAATEDVTSPSTTAVPTSTMSTKFVGSDGHEDVSGHHEETPQPAMVLPPPPPAPAPPARGYPEDVPRPLLPPALPHLSNRKCLVLDLDETLVHSSFKVSTHYSARATAYRCFNHSPLFRFWNVPTLLSR